MAGPSSEQGQERECVTLLSRRQGVGRREGTRGDAVRDIKLRGRQLLSLLCLYDNNISVSYFEDAFRFETKASPLCECLFRRQQELREAKGTSYQLGGIAEKQSDTQKEPKGTGKTPLFSRSPRFMLASHDITPKDKQRTCAQFVRNKPSSMYSSEKLVSTSKSYLPQEEKTFSLSQLAFERQFRSSKLRQENKETEKGRPSLKVTRQFKHSSHAGHPPTVTPEIKPRNPTYAQALGMQKNSADLLAPPHLTHF
ncbi:hypothetical protein HispidOSU_021562 [Sigmodon hispidus]